MRDNVPRPAAHAEIERLLCRQSHEPDRCGHRQREHVLLIGRRIRLEFLSYWSYFRGWFHVRARFYVVGMLRGATFDPVHTGLCSHGVFRRSVYAQYLTRDTCVS